jgi:hypothetical protein
MLGFANGGGYHDATGSQPQNLNAASWRMGQYRFAQFVLSRPAESSMADRRIRDPRDPYPTTLEGVYEELVSAPV